MRKLWAFVALAAGMGLPSVPAPPSAPTQPRPGGSDAGRVYRRADRYRGPGKPRTPEEYEAIAKAEAKRARRAAKRAQHDGSR